MGENIIGNGLLFFIVSLKILWELISLVMPPVAEPMVRILRKIRRGSKSALQICRAGVNLIWEQDCIFTFGFKLLSIGSFCMRQLPITLFCDFFSEQQACQPTPQFGFVGPGILRTQPRQCKQSGRLVELRHHLHFTGWAGLPP